MSFEKAMGKMKFDIRLLDYNLSQGFITQEEYNKHLSQLEDTSHLISVETAVTDEDDETDETDETDESDIDVPIETESH